MKNLVYLIILACSVSLLKGQSSFDVLLAKVNSHSQELIAARSMVDAKKLDARTGLTPENPEVEFGYMWGSPTELGTRTDWEVTQSFDFPTAYTSRSQLSKINQSQADLQYNIIRQQVFLKAWETWITRIYLNNIRAKLTDRIVMRMLLPKDLNENWKQENRIGCSTTRQ